MGRSSAAPLQEIFSQDATAGGPFEAQEKQAPPHKEIVSRQTGDCLAPGRKTRSRYAFFFCGGGAAAFAVAARLVNAAASLTAMSARTLRSRATPAALRPWISWP